MRIAQLIQCVDASGGGTSTAFLATAAAIQQATGELPQAFAAPIRDADDPAHQHVRKAPERWTFAETNGRFVFSGDLGRRVDGAAKGREFDLLHIHGLWSPDLLAAARACRRAGIPYVWEPHGMLVREAYQQKRLKKELFMTVGMRAALQHAAALVFVTAEERDHSIIPKGVGTDRLHVVPLPVIMPAMTIDSVFRQRAREQFSVPQADPAVVFMGRLHPVKRVEMAIDALAALAASPEFARARLLLIGGGENDYVESLKAHARRAGVEDRVVFAGWVQGDDKWRALAAGDILTLNSLHENFGFVAVEALCVGTLPVLTSNLAIAADLVSAGVGASCPPTHDALAQAWASALRGPASDAQRVLTHGRAWVDAHLSTAAIGRTLVNLYARILGNQNVAAH